MLVDCWDEHYIESHLERTNEIIIERLAPAAQACREAGVAVIHAPSPPQAKQYDVWTHYAGDRELGFTPAEPAPDWPPAEFRERSGPYEQFAKPPDPQLDEWRKTEGDARRIVEALGPEPGDFVIATGEKHHRLLRSREIVHLLYAGFAANMCVPGRDYGTRAMQKRGYNTILLRDGTTAIEAHDTVGELLLTTAAAYEVEMTLGSTTTTEALIEACHGRDDT